MDECIVCGEKTPYRCQPCNASFCEKHKSEHKNNKNRVHFFEKVLDSREIARIVESLMLTINKFTEFKERIMLETTTLIQKIEELCTICINNAESKMQGVKNLLNIFKNPVAEDQLKIIEESLQFSFSFNISTPNIEEILKFYDTQLIQGSPHIEESKSDSMIIATSKPHEESKSSFTSRVPSALPPKASRKTIENKDSMLIVLNSLRLEKEYSTQIYDKTLQLEEEYKGILAHIKNQLQLVVSKKIIPQSILDRIFNNDPKYVAKPNSIQSEVKALYTTIKDSLRILSDSNSELLKIINSVVYAGDIATLNSDLLNTTIPQLEIGKESCKSFIAFMASRVIKEIVTGDFTYRSIKISNDREYYFFCKF